MPPKYKPEIDQLAEALGIERKHAGKLGLTRLRYMKQRRLASGIHVPTFKRLQVVDSVKIDQRRKDVVAETVKVDRMMDLLEKVKR